MKLDLYNRVTVKCGGETRETHNAMFGVFTLAASCAYGACLAVGSGSGGEDGKTITPIATLATSVGDKNLGADKGDLFVRYEAVATDSDIAAGVSITEVGLCGEAGGALADYASFDPIVKKSGENVYFSVEVRLVYSSGGTTCFCGGNNPLVAALLGMKKLEGTFQVASGTNYHPNVPFSRAIANISYRTTVTPEITDDSITFAGLIKAGVYEAMLIMDNVAVMRDYHGTETATNVTRTINNSHFCDMIGMYVWIGSITLGGNPVSDYEQREYYEKLTEDGVNILPYRLPEGARFLGEPIGNYFAVETDHEVVVYVVEETKSSVCYKVPREDGEPCLCSDGSIFTSDGEFVVRYKVSEGAVQKTEYARSAAVKNVHAVVSEKTLVALIEGADYVCLEISGETVTELRRVSSVPADFYAWRLNDRFLGYLCKSRATALCYGANGEYASATSVLTSLLADKYEILGHGDEWVWVNDVTESKKYVVNPFCASLHQTLGADAIAFTNAFTVRSTDGAVFRVTSYYNSNGTEKTMQFKGNIPQPSSVVQVGKYLLFTDGSGKVWFRYMSARGFRLYFPYLGSGTTVMIQTSMLANPNVGGSGSNISFGIRRIV